MKMDTLEVNGFKIELPIGLDQVMDTPVRDSYQTFLATSTNDVRRHLTCLTALLPPHLRGMSSPQVLHAFGGLGASAQVVDQCVPGAVHHFHERDPVCVKYLSERYPNVYPTQDSMPMLANADLGRYDVLLLDMSVGTIKTKGVKEMWPNVAGTLTNPQKVGWFTDTSCHKIHLNYKSYAKDFGVDIEPTAESYLNAYSGWLEDKYNLTIVAAMREAGEFYCVVRSFNNFSRFQTIPYV